MTCWEYKTVHTGNGSITDEKLAELGDEGWLLCTEVHLDGFKWRYRFARPQAGDEPYPPPGAGALTADGPPAVQATPADVGHCRGKH